MGKYGVHNHYQVAHPGYVELTIPCTLCDKKFLSTRLMKEHLHQHKQKEKAKERRAAEAEMDDSELPDGQKKRKKLEPLVWKESYPMDEETFNKMRTHEIDKVCPICKFTSSSLYYLVSHMKKNKCKTDHKAVEPLPEMVIDINDEETKKLRFACGFTNCLDYGKTWGHKHSVYNYWQNEHIDTLENPVLCSHCPKKFVSTIMLNMHIKERHNQELRKRFSCSICGATRAKLSD